MCGFLYINDKLDLVNLLRSQEALNLQKHRGPDFQGEIGLNTLNGYNNFIDVRKNKTHSVHQYLGHNRLKIIDLQSKSNQPIYKNNFFFLYNGEFYNYQEYDTHKTKSDTLTLFNKLVTEGVDFLHKVNGMWSFVFGDLEKNKIFLSRDRYGKKPLYYFKNENLFIASSEIKSIFKYLDKKIREINPEHLASFMRTKLIDSSSRDTFYKDIKSVRPGEVLELNNLNLEIKKFLNLKKFPLRNFKMNSREEIKTYLKSDLLNAVSVRLNSDAPVGVLVSGGVDSTSIISNILKLKKQDNVNFFYAKQFVNSMNKVSEDDKYVKILSKELKIKLNEINLISENMEIEKIFIDLSNQFEEPFNIELSSISTYLISQQMKNMGIKVSIDGVGGDEVMNGYPTYYSLANANLQKNNFTEFLKFINLHLSNSQNTKIKDYLALASIIKKKLFKENRNEKSIIFSNKFNEFIENVKLIKLRASYTTVIKRQIFELFRFQLPYYLKTSDQCNMINSVENRSPFLDYNMFKYVFLEDKYKFDVNLTKILLREISSENIPKEIIFRKKKGGFGTSIDFNLLKTKKNVERILDCELVRMILNKNIDSYQILNEKALFKNLLILSYLSDQYSLKLNL